MRKMSAIRQWNEPYNAGDFEAGKVMEKDHKFSSQTYVKATNVMKMHLQHLKKLIIRQHSAGSRYFPSTLPLLVHRQLSLKIRQAHSCRAGKTHTQQAAERTQGGSQSHGQGRPRGLRRTP